MNDAYFACTTCHIYIDAGYRHAYWTLEKAGIDIPNTPVNVQAASWVRLQRTKIKPDKAPNFPKLLPSFYGTRSTSFITISYYFNPGEDSFIYDQIK